VTVQPARAAHKDVAYLSQLASSLGAEAPVTAATRDVFAAAATTDAFQLDISGLATRYL
jgi:3-hydroxyisobutyrate dehydrogenase-like beta-hydroxyacid dehydrogenase